MLSRRRSLVLGLALLAAAAVAVPLGTLGDVLTTLGALSLALALGAWLEGLRGPRRLPHGYYPPRRHPSGGFIPNGPPRGRRPSSPPPPNHYRRPPC